VFTEVQSAQVNAICNPKELEVSSLCYELFHAIVATNCGLPDCPVS
jgi:hypothetical protein